MRRHGVPLARTLARLEDRFLDALIRGLERGELVDGRLFSSSRGGGCAVGLMLRALDPEAFAVGRLRFWWRYGRHQSVADLRHPVPGAPLLRELEWRFDDSVAMVRRAEPSLARRAAAARVGEWFSDLARAEADGRHG